MPAVVCWKGKGFLLVRKSSHVNSQTAPKRAKILKEKEKKGEIEEGGEDQEDVIPIPLRAREHCTSSTLGPP